MVIYRYLETSSSKYGHLSGKFLFLDIDVSVNPFILALYQLVRFAVINFVPTDRDKGHRRLIELYILRLVNLIIILPFLRGS